MTIEKTINGYLRISDVINNQLITRLYIGHTKKEAIALFKNETKKPIRKPYEKN
jgi:hypothetical protein